MNEAVLCVKMTIKSKLENESENDVKEPERFSKQKDVINCLFFFRMEYLKSVLLFGLCMKQTYKISACLLSPFMLSPVFLMFFLDFNTYANCFLEFNLKYKPIYVTRRTQSIIKMKAVVLGMDVK